MRASHAFLASYFRRDSKTDDIFFFLKTYCSFSPQLYQHIVLSGGSTMYPGLPSRFVFSYWFHNFETKFDALHVKCLMCSLCFSLEKEIQDRYLDTVLKGNRDGLKVKKTS